MVAKHIPEVDWLQCTYVAESLAVEIGERASTKTDLCTRELLNVSICL